MMLNGQEPRQINQHQVDPNVMTDYLIVLLYKDYGSFLYDRNKIKLDLTDINYESG